MEIVICAIMVIAFISIIELRLQGPPSKRLPKKRKPVIPQFKYKYLEDQNVFRITLQEEVADYTTSPYSTNWGEDTLNKVFNILNQEVKEKYPEIKEFIGDQHYKNSKNGCNIYPWTSSPKFIFYLDIKLDKNLDVLTEQLLILQEIISQIEPLLKLEEKQKEIEEYNKNNEALLRKSIAESILPTWKS